MWRAPLFEVPSTCILTAMYSVRMNDLENIEC